jgi:Putative zinc-finger
MSSCHTMHDLLQAFHDDELSVSDQIAVATHIEGCARCSATLKELRAISSVFAGHAPGFQYVLSNEEAAAFSATVVSRLNAEENASIVARVRDMFDDIRLVYAGLGAAVATVVCVTIMLGMMRYATNERPDSLAGIVTLVGNTLECESGNAGNDLADASPCRERWEARFQRANESAAEDSVFALDAVVTHQSGHLANLETLRAGRRGADGQAKTIEALLDAVSRSRLEQALPIGTPVVASMVWLVEHATVRATLSKPPTLAPIVPIVPKKRAESELRIGSARA